MKRLILGACAVAMLSVVPVVASAEDPQSGRLDPPPAPLKFLETLPPRKWVFGSLLWKGPEPCTADSCEAGFYNAPVSILVSKRNACCGNPGYSILVTGSASNCQSVSYYLGWSNDIERLTDAERLSFLSRQVHSIAGSVRVACRVEDGGPIPTDVLARLVSQVAD